MILNGQTKWNERDLTERISDVYNDMIIIIIIIFLIIFCVMSWLLFWITCLVESFHQFPEISADAGRCKQNYVMEFPVVDGVSRIRSSDVEIELLDYLKEPPVASSLTRSSALYGSRDRMRFLGALWGRCPKSASTVRFCNEHSR